MDIERERGITIKAQTVRLDYKAKDGKLYQLNLMDTPGHVDFAYEVSRCLAACEGAVLVVDASQGVEAQTLANVYQALDNNLEILPVLNKVDLPAADSDRVKQQIEDVIGLDASDAIPISAKTGHNVEAVLEAIVERLPPPAGRSRQAAQGAADRQLVRRLSRRRRARAHHRRHAAQGPEDHADVDCRQLSDRARRRVPSQAADDGRAGPRRGRLLHRGHQGSGRHARRRYGHRCAQPDHRAAAGLQAGAAGRVLRTVPGRRRRLRRLRDAMGRLRLNDASFSFEMETSAALGLGFRCGFLGLLHLEIITERLEREFNLDLITTAPSVIYNIYLTDGTMLEMHNPADMPETTRIERIEEPWIKATIMVPDEYLGGILKLCQDRRGRQKDLTYAGSRAMLVYELPLNEVVFDFYDRLKSISKGYASFDYQIKGYEENELVKLSVLVNEEPVDALSMIVHRTRAESRGRSMCEKLKELIRPHLFKIPIQAAIGGKVIARETISALRKDVIAKCYGGDITRKRKLLEKQKKGKKKMRQFGSVDIPAGSLHRRPEDGRELRPIELRGLASRARRRRKIRLLAS